MYIVKQLQDSYLYSTDWNLLGYVITGKDIEKAVLYKEGEAKTIIDILNKIDGLEIWTMQLFEFKDSFKK